MSTKGTKKHEGISFEIELGQSSLQETGVKHDGAAPQRGSIQDCWAAIEVHRELGSGFLEPVYQEAMAIELASCSIPYEAQKALQIMYKGRKLKKEYVPDFVCYQQIIVELKALVKLSGVEEAQALNYLKATKFRVALLLNFGSYGKLEWKRLVL